jgi:hypothetical protein
MDDASGPSNAFFANSDRSIYGNNTFLRKCEIAITAVTIPRFNIITEEPVSLKSNNSAIPTNGSRRTISFLVKLYIDFFKSLNIINSLSRL